MKKLLIYFKSYKKNIYKYILVINKMFEQILIYYMLLAGLKHFDPKIAINYMMPIVAFIIMLKLIVDVFINRSSDKKSNFLESNIVIYPFLFLFIINSILNNSTLFHIQLYLYLLNFSITISLRRLYNHELDQEKYLMKLDEIKTSLLHELGHYFICKEYDLFTPISIELFPDSKTDARFTFEGNLNDVFPYAYLQFLSAGYISTKYFSDEINNFTVDEVRYNLLKELYYTNNHSPGYLKKIIEIYLNDEKIEFLIRYVIDILEKYREEIISMAEQNKNKRIINLTNL